MTCPSCHAGVPAGSRYCPHCAAPQGGAAAPTRRRGGGRALVVAAVVGAVAAVTVAAVVIVGARRASTTIGNSLTPKPGRPPGYQGLGYPGMLVQDRVAAGAGASIQLYGEAVTAGGLTATPTLLGPTLCVPVTLVDRGATTVNVGPGEWKLQAPDGVVETYAITGSLQNGQLAPGGTTGGTVCFADRGPSGTFELLWQPLLRIGRGVWRLHFR